MDMRQSAKLPRNWRLLGDPLTKPHTDDYRPPFMEVTPLFPPTNLHPKAPTSILES